ncbi:MAG: hypothetical protein QME64_08295 [bacterium]|nr:hypothetical protein [bacterium]
MAKISKMRVAIPNPKMKDKAIFGKRDIPLSLLKKGRPHIIYIPAPNIASKIYRHSILV